MKSSFFSRSKINRPVIILFLAAMLPITGDARVETQAVKLVIHADSSSTVVQQLPSAKNRGSHLDLSAESVVFVVTSLADLPDDSLEDGVFFPQTLRSAIENANLTAAMDTIYFDAGIDSLYPDTELPPIDYPVHISLVTLDGSNITPVGGVSQFGLALRLDAHGSVLEFVEIRNFPDAGLFIGVNDMFVSNCDFHGNTGAGILGNAARRTEIGGCRAYGNLGTGGDGIQLYTDILGNPSDSNNIYLGYFGTSDGVSATPNERAGLRIAGAHNVIAGNQISGNNYEGIVLGEDDQTPSFANNILGNSFGLNIAENDTLPNGTGNTGDGIYIRYGQYDTIVGNDICGSVGNGIHFVTEGSYAYIAENSLGVESFDFQTPLGNHGSGMFIRGHHNMVEGNSSLANLNGAVIIGDSNVVTSNLFGTVTTGVHTNQYTGLRVSGDNNVVGGSDSTGNVCSGNGSHGITVSGAGSTGNLVKHNFVGIDSVGTILYPNGQHGITIVDSTHGTMIVENIIDGNDSAGVYLGALFGRRPRGTILEENLIGLWGPVLDGNRGSGVVLDGAVDSYIGNPASGKGNKIAYNDIYGVEIRQADSTTIFRDSIIFSGGSGVFIDSGKFNFIVQSVIASNDYHGVYIVNADSTRIFQDTIIYNGANGVSVINGKYNQVFENVILGNGYYGIDLGNDGITTNDIDDLDDGPNNYQNYPVIFSVTSVNDTLNVVGEIDGAPFTDYVIDMYANYECDSSGYGEGQEWVDSAVVQSVADGTAVIDFKAASSYDPTYSFLTFIATDQDGNSSEFSPCFELALIVADLEVSTDVSQDTVAVGDEITYTITVTNNGPDDATGTMLVDTIPIQLTYLSDTCSQGTSSIIDNRFSCDIGTLAPGADATIVLVVTADSTGSVSNTAVATASEPDNLPQNNSSATIVEIVDPGTGVDADGNDALPTEFRLSQNYPNPFNPSTLIEFELPHPAVISIAIYNLRGQEVVELVHAGYAAGRHRIEWDGLTNGGERAASGIYLYRLKSDRFTETRKMVLLK